MNESFIRNWHFELSFTRKKTSKFTCMKSIFQHILREFTMKGFGIESRFNNKLVIENVGFWFFIIHKNIQYLEIQTIKLTYI